jgi:7-dehydrocholesterol reductase
MTKPDIKTWGDGGLFGNGLQRALGSLALMVTTPFFLYAFIYTCNEHDGAFMNLYNEVLKDGFVSVLFKMWPSPFDPEAWKIITAFSAFELFLTKAVPGKIFKATPTVTGHIPTYIANGFESYILSIGTLLFLAHFGYIHPEVVYDKFDSLLSSMNLFAIILCIFLTIKGLNFPSTKDSGTNGNLIIDFFWGTELYPQILGWDVKQFTNSRFGLMSWQIIVLCYAYKQYAMLGYLSSSMIVSVAIQTVYVAKFFLWETGYFCSMDIQHDRAGYYICWGCLVWVPSMYTIHTYFLVEHPILLSVPVATFFLLAGFYCVWVNYDCDNQRQLFRASGGKMKIWGSDAEYIEADYLTDDGEKRTSLLLASGWWGVARHFHYIPEIMAAFFWCAPALFTHPLPYFYPLFLTLLLIDRAWRDDARCAAKYKLSWDAYCAKVPYKIIPGVI